MDQVQAALLFIVWGLRKQAFASAGSRLAVDRTGLPPFVFFVSLLMRCA